MLSTVIASREFSDISNLIKLRSNLPINNAKRHSELVSESIQLSHKCQTLKQV